MMKSEHSQAQIEMGRFIENSSDSFCLFWFVFSPIERCVFRLLSHLDGYAFIGHKHGEGPRSMM